MGIDDVLGVNIASTESAYISEEIIQDLKDRGLKEDLLVVTDVSSGIDYSIDSVYLNV